MRQRRTRHARDFGALRSAGVDVSAVQIERAKQNVPKARFLHGDLMELEFGEEFDAITAFYVIEHVLREQHGSVFERFRRWLRPSGWLLFTIEPEAEPGIVGDWLGAPMFFSQYDAGTTLELVAEVGLRYGPPGRGDATGGQPRSLLPMGPRSEKVGLVMNGTFEPGY